MIPLTRYGFCATLGALAILSTLPAVIHRANLERVRMVPVEKSGPVRVQPFETKGRSKLVTCTVYSAYYIGHDMRNGQPYDPHRMTCAVPRSKWNQLQGKTLRFGYGSKWITVKVTDSCGWVNGHEVTAYDLSGIAFKALFGFQPTSVKGVRMSR